MNDNDTLQCVSCSAYTKWGDIVCNNCGETFTHSPHTYTLWFNTDETSDMWAGADVIFMGTKQQCLNAMEASTRNGLHSITNAEFKDVAMRDTTRPGSPAAKMMEF